jgi:hypothetical protein
MPNPPRRATIALHTGLAAFHAIPAEAAPQDSSPDAELIRLCGEYVKAVDAYNSGPAAEPEDDPLWQAVIELDAKLEGLAATTLDGLAAKARVALHQAKTPDGGECFEVSYVGSWPEQVVRDLLGMMSEAGT